MEVLKKLPGGCNIVKKESDTKLEIFESIDTKFFNKIYFLFIGLFLLILVPIYIFVPYTRTGEESKLLMYLVVTFIFAYLFGRFLSPFAVKYMFGTITIDKTSGFLIVYALFPGRLVSLAVKLSDIRSISVEEGKYGLIGRNVKYIVLNLNNGTKQQFAMFEPKEDDLINFYLSLLQPFLTSTQV